MAGAGNAADEPVRVAVAPCAAVRRYRRTLRVAHALIETHRGGLGADRELDRAVRIHLPGVFEVEIHDIPAHQVRIGEPGVWIGCRDFGKCAGLHHGLADRFRRKVGSAGAALALLAVDSDADSAITRVFEVLHITEARRRGEPLVVTGGGLGLVGAHPRRLVQRQPDTLLQFFRAQ